MKLHDLHISGVISKQDLRDVARQVFKGQTLVCNFGYNLQAPKFDDLDSRLQGYIIKAMEEVTAIDVLSSTTPPSDHIDEGDMVVPFPDHVDGEDTLVGDLIQDNDPDDGPLVA